MIDFSSSTPKSLKGSSILLGTTALACLAITGAAQAADFKITSGTTTNDGNTINGNDTVTVTEALVTTGGSEGIDISKVNARPVITAKPLLFVSEGLPQLQQL